MDHTQDVVQESLFITNKIIAEGIRSGCRGEARDYLEEICMELPEEKCLPAPTKEKGRCSEIEFDCEDGQCIPGLGLCDRKYHCRNGADELKWWVYTMFFLASCQLFKELE